MISYTDSEVRTFHPLCEKALTQAIAALGLSSIYEAKHHVYTGSLEMDYVVINKTTGKYLCVIEVKELLQMYKVPDINFKRNRMFNPIWQ